MTDAAPELLSAPVSDTATIEAHYHMVSTGDVLAGPLGFQLALPRSWSFEILDRTGPLPEKPLVTLARAADPKSAAETIILAAHLPREVHPADWLRVFVANKGHEVLDWRERPSKFGRIPDALVRGLGRTEGMGHRLSVIKDANRLFILDSRMASPDPAHQEAAFLALSNFRLLAPEGLPHAEPFRPLVLPSERPVETLVSGLWYEIDSAVTPPEGGAAAVLENRRDEVTLATLLIVAGAPHGPDAAALEKVSLEKFEANGVLRTAGPDILSDYSSPDGTLHLLARSWAGKRGEIPVSILSAQADLDGVPVALSLLTPSPDADFEAWAIHRRAFDIAVNGLAVD